MKQNFIKINEAKVLKNQKNNYHNLQIWIIAIEGFILHKKIIIPVIGLSS
jgi:hypothetical protein